MLQVYEKFLQVSFTDPFLAPIEIRGKRHDNIQRPGPDFHPLCKHGSLWNGFSGPNLATDYPGDFRFFDGAVLVGEPKIVGCTLSGGAVARCYSITVKADLQSYTPGPWCPSKIADGAKSGGIWLRDGVVHKVDGAFIANLAKFYGDTSWQLFDKDTGNVRFT